MTSLYLQNIRLQQFRSFSHLNIDLPPEPGVLIVHGSNGIGKSSLFNALEWNLAGSIDQFESVAGADKPERYLCRRENDSTEATSVALTFSDGHERKIIERELIARGNNKSVLSGEVTDIVEFLRAPEWQSKISDIGSYLLLTHFLGQTTMSRSTNQDPKRGFKILHEAAQSASIQAIADNLYGRGNDSVIRAYRAEIDRIQAKKGPLESLIKQEQRYWNDIGRFGGLDESFVDKELGEIADTLKQCFGKLFSYEHAELRNGNLSREVLENALNQLEFRCVDVRHQIQIGEAMIDQQQHAVAKIEELVASGNQVEKTLASFNGILNASQSDVSSSELQVKQLAKKMQIAQTKSERIDTVRRSSNEYSRLLAAVNFMQVRVSTAGESRDKVKANYLRATRRMEIIRRLSMNIEEYSLEITKAQTRISLLSEATACMEGVEACSENYTSLLQSNPATEQRLLETRNALKNIAGEVDQKTEVVENMRGTVDAMSQAIATLAIELPADACECPLCATHFKNASGLRERIDNAVERLAPTLVNEEELLATMIEEYDNCCSEVAHLERVSSELASAHEQLKTQQSRLDELLIQTDLTEKASIEMLLEIKSGLAENSARLAEKLKRKKHWLTVLRTGFSGEISINILRDQLQQTEGDLDRSNRDLEQATEECNQAYSRYERACQVLEYDEKKSSHLDLDTLWQNADFEFSLAQEELKAANQVLSNARIQLSRYLEEQAAFETRLKTIQNSQKEYEIALQEIETVWHGLHVYGLKADSNSLRERSNQVAEIIQVIDEVKLRLERLRENENVLDWRITHETILQGIRKTVGLSAEAKREETVIFAKNHLQELNEYIDSTNSVKEIAKSASQQITKELSKFSKDYILPLSELMTKINQTILCDRDVGIDLEVKGRRINQRAVKGKLISESVDPKLIHSEGQLAALAVSMLCAASLTFQWSKWKALILDDPLQHNDSIHSAAFADMMGNLAKEEGYQIILSTHDIGQAEFLRRKFRSRKVPCTTLNLLGVGREGVEWSQHSSAGKNPQISAVNTGI
ncbi:AAA family ATPase [Thalassospira sp.]|uniref:AAA family ATPase n=1 Tax=Thalassospira sp. TaxID=1912094 RepID=UPI0032EFCD81